MNIRKHKRRTMAMLASTTRVEFVIQATPEARKWLSSPRGNVFVNQALRAAVKRPT
jgi:hypothetical protein